MITVPPFAFILLPSRCLSIGVAHDDGFHETFHVPTGFHELNRQPVEQLRMTRPLALRAKVFRRFDDACPEDVSPESVHHDASGQRVLATDQPAGEAEAVFGSILGQRR